MTLPALVIRSLRRAALAAGLLAAAPALASGQTADSSLFAPPRFEWDDHPSIDLGKGTRVDFRARVQTHLRRSGAPFDDPDETALDFARRRIGIDGEIANVFEFQVERELGDDTEPWRDVYLDYRQFDHVRVQAGKFKLPFSLDENTSSTNLDFVHRSLAANQLAPGRDVGFMVHGRIAARRVRYEAGVFTHDGDNARTNNRTKVYGDRTFAGRLRVEPFRGTKRPAESVELGVAWTAADITEGQSSLRGQTVLGSRFFDPDYFVSGRRQRVGLEARWEPGPFSVKAEYIRLSTERLGQSVEDTDLSPLIASGWYASSTWVLTGERKANGLTRPRHPVHEGGIGALEIAVRVERISFRSAATGGLPSSSPRADVILGNRDRALTMGVNWYLNRWVKVQANAIHEALDAPALGPHPDSPGFWSGVVRLQLEL